MDARINPAAAFGIKEGDAHVIRNAGGRASDDAVSSSPFHHSLRTPPKTSPNRPSLTPPKLPPAQIRSFVISHKLLGTKEWFVVHQCVGSASPLSPPFPPPPPAPPPPPL